MLTFSRLGPDAGLPLVIAHGLFGSGRNWGVIQKRLSDMRPVVAVDMRNHAGSFWSPSHAYGDLAVDLAEVVRSLGGRADVLGHSMGGKAAMRLALERPEMVRRLVVADIAPVAYEHSQTPLVHAMRRLDLGHVTTRGDADRHLSQDVPEEGTRAFLLQSLDLRADPPRWRLNLDVLEAEMSGIVGWKPVAGTFDGPALFLSGAASSYVRPEHRPQILAQFPKARFAKIPGAGHWLHAERPREFEAAVRVFLDAP